MFKENPDHQETQPMLGAFINKRTKVDWYQLDSQTKTRLTETAHLPDRFSLDQSWLLTHHVTNQDRYLIDGGPPLHINNQTYTLRGYDLPTNRPIAIKFIPCQPKSIPPQVEIRLQDKINSRHSIPIYDVVQTYQDPKDGAINPYLGYFAVIMAYQDPRIRPTLEQLLKTNFCFPKFEVNRITYQIAESLQYVHTHHHILSHDIKPANFFVSKEDTLSADFGLTNFSQRMCPPTPGTILGTPAHLSPEAAQGKKQRLPTAVFCLALMTYEMMTGQLFLQGDTVTELIKDAACTNGLKSDHAHLLYQHNYNYQTVAVLNRALQNDYLYRQPTPLTYAQQLSTALQIP